MANALKIVSTADATLFDFNDPTGAANPGTTKTYLLGDVDLGSPSIDQVLFEASNRPGGQSVFYRHSFSPISFRFRANATTYDNLRTGILELQKLIAAGGILKIIPDGSATTLYADFLPGAIPGLLAGQELALTEVVKRFDTPKGIGISLLRQPGLRGASATFINALTFGVNPSASVQARTFTMTGNTEAPLNLTVSPVQAGSKTSDIIVAARTRSDVQTLVDTTGWAKLAVTERGWTSALSNGTTSVDDTANGSVANVAQVDNADASSGYLARRIRLTRTASVDSLRGWSYVFVRGRRVDSGAGGLDMYVQGKWAAGTPDPVMNILPTVHLKFTDLGYFEIPLGIIRIPEDAVMDGFTFELWTRRNFTDDVNFDIVRFLPCTPEKDLLTKITVPWETVGEWVGAELLTPVTSPAAGTAGVVDGTALNLDTVTDNAGTPPNAGITVPAGRHRAIYDIARVNATSPLIRIRNVTDGGDVTIAQHPLFGLGAGEVDNGDRARVTAEFTVPAGTNAITDLYQIQLRQSGVLHTLEHAVRRSLDQNEIAKTDPEAGKILRQDSGGDFKGLIANEGGVPLYCAPGLTGLFIVPLDVPSTDNPYPESVKARTVTVTAAGAPRFLG